MKKWWQNRSNWQKWGIIILALPLELAYLLFSGAFLLAWVLIYTPAITIKAAIDDWSE